MKSINVLLVDDEFLALNLLENFVQRLPELNLIDKVKSPIQALEILQTKSIQIINSYVIEIGKS